MEDKATVLVTGGTGFVARQIILQLLQKGYRVRTTVRNPASTAELKDTLIAQGVTAIDYLSFAEAELTKDDNWQQVMEGCKYVLSVASPIFFKKLKNEQEAIRPAVEGILRILKFAKLAGVQRVVMASNFGAVGFTQTDKSRETTETDWTDTAAKGLSVYEKSKTLAERAAWDFIRSEGGNLEFVTINAVAILGPALDAHISGSFHLLKNLLNGSMKAVPEIALNIVDVRDVADLHIRAMLTPEAGGQRFIASANGQISLPEIAALLKKERPYASQLVATRRLPTWILRLVALVNGQAKEALLLIRMNRNVSNQKARSVLGWRPIAPQEETLLASVDSMVKYNLIKVH
ncbi:NAD-dependent epimerase/dehydratase family protein [Flavobacterium zepuense]|uniref:NAD-dependent epimerase/dehydratase family protein n=1 Tax=Flavobacterium zepuense TaxID=2593302 RepID=A0A552V9K9_9FLAO|nr:NAD-dependent epimerase/dehydratase family protein [Flavobacterium zepuense]TRW27153.1 NAD-dependent epimerase/dehydratase family protein [Flavobacterium zepuense]